MKTMLKVTISLFFLLLASTTISAQNSGEKWTYKSIDAPYGYESGEILFSKKGEKLYANISINGNTLDPVEVIQKKEGKEIELYVDGSDVVVTWTLKNKDEAQGKVAFDGSEIVVLLTRKVKK
jgi:hypothetical protein